jgi:outer membrane lipoprotein
VVPRLLAFLLLLTGCATTPRPAAEGPLASITLEQARTPAAAGAKVRWGGEILEVRPGKGETCFEVLARDLSGSGRPKDTDSSQGRFIACAPGFYDPAVYSRGRELTFTGTVMSPEQGKIGEHAYVFPRLAADGLYLWPKRDYLPPAAYYDPWFGWYDPLFPHPFYRHRWPYRYYGW